MSEQPKWTESYKNERGKPYKTTDGYIKMLIRTGKIGSPSYQRWVEAGKPKSKSIPTVGFVYADWQ